MSVQLGDYIRFRTGMAPEDFDALAAAFGNRLWGEPRREADSRECEIQDQIVFPARFHS